MNIKIHYAPGTPVMSQRKLLKVLLNASEGMWEKERHEITLTHIRKLSGLHMDDKALWKLLRDLLGVHVEICWKNGIPTTPGCIWALASNTILCAVEVNKSKLYYTYSSDFKKYIMDEAEIVPYIKQLLSTRFRSKYAIRLYQFCLDHHQNREGASLTRFINLDKLRETLGCASEKSYEKYSEFNRCVLKRAIQTINTETDIHVAVSAYQRNANSITAIRLTISPNDIGKQTGTKKHAKATVNLAEITEEYERDLGEKE